MKTISSVALVFFFLLVCPAFVSAAVNIVSLGASATSSSVVNASVKCSDNVAGEFVLRDAASVQVGLQNNSFNCTAVEQSVVLNLAAGTSLAENRNYSLTAKINSPCSVCEKQVFFTFLPTLTNPVPETNLLVVVIVVFFVVFFLSKRKTN